MGLVFGLFLAIFHAVWLILVALMPAAIQSLIYWILALHGLSMPVTVIGATWGGAIMLIIVTFVVGYLMGWVFDWLVKKVRK